MVISEARWSNAAYAILVAGVMIHFAFVAVLVAGRGHEVAWLAVLAAYAFTFAMLRLFQTVRVRVDGMDLRVGFPIFNKRIPLHDIEGIAPIHYGWLQWGGWGVRFHRGAVLYNVPGDKGRAVELTLRSGKRVLFSAEDPEAAAQAIRAQRALVP